MGQVASAFVLFGDAIRLLRFANRRRFRFRFNHALISLDEKTTGLVTDVLEKGSYVRFKEQLIRRFSVSEKAKHLLNELTLDDRIREIKQLGEDEVGSLLLKSLWLQRLPESTRAIGLCFAEGVVRHGRQDPTRKSD